MANPSLDTTNPCRGGAFRAAREVNYLIPSARTADATWLHAARPCSASSWFARHFAVSVVFVTGHVCTVHVATRATGVSANTISRAP